MQNCKNFKGFLAKFDLKINQKEIDFFSINRGEGGADLAQKNKRKSSQTLPISFLPPSWPKFSCPKVKKFCVCKLVV